MYIFMFHSTVNTHIDLLLLLYICKYGFSVLFFAISTALGVQGQVQVRVKIQVQSQSQVKDQVNPQLKSEH